MIVKIIHQHPPLLCTGSWHSFACLCWSPIQTLAQLLGRPKFSGQHDRNSGSPTSSLVERNQWRSAGLACSPADGRMAYTVRCSRNDRNFSGLDRRSQSNFLESYPHVLRCWFGRRLCPAVPAPLRLLRVFWAAVWGSRAGRAKTRDLPKTRPRDSRPAACPAQTRNACDPVCRSAAFVWPADSWTSSSRTQTWPAALLHRCRSPQVGSARVGRFFLAIQKKFFKLVNFRGLGARAHLPITLTR